MTIFDQAQKYLFDNRYFLLYCLGISFLAFGFEIFNVAISIDEEMASLSPQPLKVWLQMDRWGMYALNWLLQSGAPLPFFNMLLGLAANLATFLLCLHIWKMRNGVARYLAAVFALTHPTLAFVYAFNQSQYGYFVGLFFAVLGVASFILNTSKAGRITLATTCWILALSIYQSVIFAAPTVYLIYLVSRNISPTQEIKKSEQLLKEIFFFIGCLLLAVLAHEFISNYFRNTFGQPGRYHTIEQFYSGEFLIDYDPLFVIREVVAQLIGHRWYVGYLTGVTFLICLWALTKYILAFISVNRDRILTLILLFGAILSPFIFVIITADFWPARTMMALPVMMGGLVYISADHLVKNFKKMLVIVIGCCLFIYVGSNTRLFYSDYVAWQNDKLLANRIVTTIEMKYGDLIKEKSIPIAFIGAPEHSSLEIRVKEETFGGSLFAWDDGSNARSTAILRLIDVDYFIPANQKKIREIVSVADTMPSWPSQESVLWKDGVVIVKFSEEK